MSYFELTGQFREGHVSEGLKEFGAYYSNRLSYEEVEQLIARTTGEKQLSDMKVQKIVIEKALEVSRKIKEEVEEVLYEGKGKMPAIKEEVDIYDSKQKEILLFDDGIQVKEQKKERHRIKDRTKEESKPRRKRVNTDVVVLEKQGGQFEYIVSGVDEQGQELLPLKDVVKAKFIQEYAQADAPLNVVAITDGAKNIRARLLSIFGVVITIILDWYHLQKRVSQLMSMIAFNKTQKELHLVSILSFLWQGMTDEALTYLKNKVQVKNQAQYQALLHYLQKHKAEIIDYQRRQDAGKTIGSGRGEKACDQVVGHRQKKKGMSWSKLGSRSLAILKVVELNHLWSNLWHSSSSLS